MAINRHRDRYDLTIQKTFIWVFTKLSQSLFDQDTNEWLVITFKFDNTLQLKLTYLVT